MSTEIVEETVIGNLDRDFSNVKATRFVKRDKTVLGTVRLTFSSAEDATKAVNLGLLIDHLFYRPSYFIHQGVKIIRRYNCQKFIHVSAIFKFGKHCGHCSQNHYFTDCRDKHLDPTCASCGNNHQTGSFHCQLYLNQNQKLYNVRYIPLPKSAMKALKTTTKHKTTTFVQLNICGISEHNKTAFEKFLDEKRPFLVCLNETNFFLKSDFFNNFHREASHTGNSGESRLQLTKGSF